MKITRNILLFLGLSVSTFLIARIDLNNPNKGVQWNKLVHDFDTIHQGDVVETEFICYNFSDTSLQFENVQGSCGCIVSKWEKKPILQGDSSIIKVTFDSHGKIKHHEKVIAVYSNQGLFELSIKAMIIK
jgi:hypothetical protein